MNLNATSSEAPHRHLGRLRSRQRRTHLRSESTVWNALVTQASGDSLYYGLHQLGRHDLLTSGVKPLSPACSEIPSRRALPVYDELCGTRAE